MTAESRGMVAWLANSRVMRPLPAVLRSPFALNNGVYFAGNLFAGLAGFAFQGLLASRLGADGFAEVAPLISIFYLIQIPMFISMAVAARYTAPLADGGDHSRVQRAYIDLTRTVSFIGFAGMLVFIAITPLIREFLHLPGYGPLVVLSAAIPLSLLVGVGRGVVQGEERFPPLSLNFILYGTTTLAALPVILATHLKAVGAMAAIDVALALCNFAAALTLRDLPHAGHHERLRVWPVLRSALVASAGITAITLFYNFDVLLAKHFLTGTDPGLYSAMSLLGKILFFGTISISAVMFPRVAALHAEGRYVHRVVNLSLGMVVAAGGLVTAFYWIFPRFTVSVLLRNPEYLAITPYLGIFALAMLGLAISNVLVYYFVAVHRKVFGWGLVVGATAFGLLLIRFHHNLAEFTTSVTLAINLMAVTLLVIYAFDHPRPERPHVHAEPGPPPLAVAG